MKEKFFCLMVILLVVGSAIVGCAGQKNGMESNQEAIGNLSSQVVEVREDLDLLAGRVTENQSKISQAVFKKDLDVLRREFSAKFSEGGLNATEVDKKITAWVKKHPLLFVIPHKVKKQLTVLAAGKAIVYKDIIMKGVEPVDNRYGDIDQLLEYLEILHPGLSTDLEWKIKRTIETETIISDGNDLGEALRSADLPSEYLATIRIEAGDSKEEIRQILLDHGQVTALITMARVHLRKDGPRSKILGLLFKGDQVLVGDSVGNRYFVEVISGRRQGMKGTVWQKALLF